MNPKLNTGLAKVFKRLHYPFDVMLLCVRWYVAYPLSRRHLEEMMAERGLSVDHSTVHRWALKMLPRLEKAFRCRKRPVGGSWRMDETYVKIGKEWKYLYRAIDKAATPLTSCCEPSGTRLRPTATSRRRSIRTAHPRL
ncbi:Transposase and inactivated derivatives-like protein [Burkholderia ambifaria MEX-5]|uniref:Transposase and inactivated derivatives-like protein n=1 Tax=Burkholderia ambifaria MEX-5 TaxID=396597 RepID=B1T201_9BURK|nr:Transposase and inactivated derivatives-like protein [Burkholderia ambifaria MEX-5]